MRAAYLDERAYVIEQARAQYREVAPKAARARETAETVRKVPCNEVLGGKAVGLSLVEQCTHCSFVPKDVFIVDFNGITVLSDEIENERRNVFQTASAPLSVVVDETVADDV